MVTLAAGNGVDLFLPKEADLIWSSVVLVVLLCVFGFYIMPKFSKVLDERARRIQGEMDVAKKTHEEAMEAKAQYEKDLANAHSEALQIRSEAETQAATIISEARGQAQKNTDRMTQQAKESIDAQRQRAENSLKDDVATLAIDLAGKILGQKLKDDQMQNKVIDNFLDHMESTSDVKSTEPTAKTNKSTSVGRASKSTESSSSTKTTKTATKTIKTTKPTKTTRARSAGSSAKE